MRWTDRLRAWARNLKRESVALWFAARDPRMPWAARALALFTVGYALSPIDLIPDFIPVLGYLDDVVIVPLGIVAAVGLVPAGLMAEFRQRASEAAARPRSYAGAVVVAAIWIAAAFAVAWWAWRR